MLGARTLALGAISTGGARVIRQALVFHTVCPFRAPMHVCFSFCLVDENLTGGHASSAALYLLQSPKDGKKNSGVVPQSPPRSRGGRLTRASTVWRKCGARNFFFPFLSGHLFNFFHLFVFGVRVQEV